MKTYEIYRKLGLDGACINLEPDNDPAQHFCTPVGLQVIGTEGAIQYGFIDGFGDMVFAVNPETVCDQFVYPLAANFADFLRLILTCRSTTPVEQIAWMSREQFDANMAEEMQITVPGRDDTLRAIAEKLALSSMPDPYGYVKQLQSQFNPSGIAFTDEYYDVLGIEKP